MKYSLEREEEAGFQVFPTVHEKRRTDRRVRRFSFEPGSMPVTKYTNYAEARIPVRLESPEKQG